MPPIALRCAASCLLLFASAAASAATPDEVKALFEAKDPRAPAAVAALLKAEPDDIEVRVLAVRQLLREGKAEDAVDSAEDLVDDAEDHAQAQYWLGNAYSQRVGQVGMFSKLLMAPKLRDAWEAAIRLDPELTEARFNLVQYYLHPLAIGGGIDKAKAQVVEIAKRDAARGHTARGMVLIAEEKPDEALKAYEAAHAANPGHKDYRLNLGIAYQTAKLWPKAFALFEKWTAEDAKAATAWYQLGRTSALSGLQPEQGIAALRQFLTLPLTPELPQAQYAWYRMGQILATAGRKDEARQAFQSSLKMDPKMAEAKAELAKL